MTENETHAMRLSHAAAASSAQPRTVWLAHSSVYVCTTAQLTLPPEGGKTQTKNNNATNNKK